MSCRLRCATAAGGPSGSIGRWRRSRSVAGRPSGLDAIGPNAPNAMRRPPDRVVRSAAVRPRRSIRSPVTRARWERERAKVETRYARAQGQPRAGRPPLPPDEHARVRKARAAYDVARRVAEQPAGDPAGNARSNTGSGRDSAAGSERFHANLTDPDSRLQKTRNGWIQGYNCQLAASADGFIVSARATQDTNDVGQFVPTMNDVTATVEQLAVRTGRDDLTVGTLVGDAGYDSEHNLAAEGPDRLIADGKRREIDQRAATDPATGDPPQDARRREQMNHRLRTSEGHALYKRRAPLIEAPNAWLKDGRGLRRFARRGLDSAQAELTLACTVTNLLKLATKGVTTSQLQGG